MAKTSAAKSQSIYDVHPGVLMVQKWVEELKGKTGRSLDEWIALVKKEGPKGEKERREWLKAKHKFGTNNAGWIAEHAEGKGGKEDSPEAYLIAAVEYVALYRHHVFAQVKPPTNTRIDLGLALAGYKGKLPRRLIDTGGMAKKDRITHRIEIKSMADVDEDAAKWLKSAYDLDI
jgi:hypothetical protein